MATISELTKETVYTVEVAAETRAGTGVNSLPLTIQTPDSECVSNCSFDSDYLSHNNSDVYLSLNGTVIPNHGYVEIDDIGSTDDTALLCHTNRPPPTPGCANSGGDWFAPDRTRVYSTYVPGIIRVRGPMVGDPREGIYRCSLLDNTSTVIHLYVGLYNSGQGCIECFEA